MAVPLIFEPPRFVRPRKPYSKKVPMIVVDAQYMAWSDIDAIPVPRPIDKVLVEYVSNGNRGKHPSSLLVCANPVRLLLHLNKIFLTHSQWNYKLSIHDKDTFVNGVIKTAKDDAAVSFFGFRDDQHRHTWYHYIICPTRYARMNLNQLVPGDQPELAKLYEWAQSVYEFAQRNGIKLSGSAGGLASQLLRDKKFYPVERRKIPMATNERAREALPGNHYDTKAELHRAYKTALYFDQENAHHWAAENTLLPDPDWLYAKGYYWRKDQQWCTPRDKEFKQVIENEHGLLHVQINIPRYIDGYLPAWATGKPGIRDAYIYTNELPLLEALHIEIYHLYSAWTSPKVDNGIKRYSIWAQEQIREYPQDKKWLKSVLLSAYGVLASKPRKYEFGYHRAKGKPVPFHLGPNQIYVVRTSSKRKQQLPIANVIHRGMIEAETRKLSIELARQLENEDREVLSIYADGVIVRDNGEQIPMLPRPWRPKHVMKHVEFVDGISFKSDVLTKMPGRYISKDSAQAAAKSMAEDREWIERCRREEAERT